MSASATALFRALRLCPLVAILRGIEPGEAEEVGCILVDAGFSIVEVPLNSPRALESIERLAAAIGGRAVVGAGTVLKPSDVLRVRDAGGSLVVAPNVVEGVVSLAVSEGLSVVPGVLTPTEAFAALEFGATALKLFPAEVSSPAALRAMRAVLPAETAILPVGGVTPDAMPAWLKAGASGFGVGSALYRPGKDRRQLSDHASAFVAAVRGAAERESQHT
jgi:2-dehydro-3-deoxyphosphogalactonate aldolase